MDGFEARPSHDDEGSCRHPDWVFPSPLPTPGTLCDYCGEPYVASNTVINDTRWDELDPEMRDDIRAIATIRAIQFELENKEINTRTAKNLQERIVRARGWTEQYEDTHL